MILIFLCGSFICGCGGRSTRMAQPEDPHGRYREQIAVARQVLEQKERWADRVEWEVKKNRTGWEVVAWRIEHPDRNECIAICETLH
jgi:hypothetical protein